MDQKDTNPGATPQSGGPVMDVQAPKPAVPADPVPTSAPTPESAKPLKAPKTGKTPIGVILLAILVALSLGALTVFAYMKTKDTPLKKDQSSQTEQKATAKDVDDTTKGIDESLKSMDDNADFNDSDLSDSNLGL